MEDQRFKTMRHIEAVRNYLTQCVRELLERAERHDQSKLESPEREVFDEFTPKLRGVTYGSEQYRDLCRQMKPAIEHHHKNNSHHPEYYKDGIEGMNLFDLVEMLCDWKAASMRHDDGDVFTSLAINADRFGMSPQLKNILSHTIKILENSHVFHHAEES